VTLEQQREEAEKTHNLAVTLFPNETWEKITDKIFVATGRILVPDIFEKELIQAEILAKNGSTVYFLPEKQKVGMKSADAVVDGILVEFKTITGGIDMVEKRFRKSRKQCENVFLKIDNPEISKKDVQERIRRTLLDKKYLGGTGGLAIVYIAKTAEIYYWRLADLK
jgi:hypothetical protein